MDSAGVECGLKILGMGLLPGDSATHKCAASNIPVSRTSTPMVRPMTTDFSRISLFSAMPLFLTQNLNSPCHLCCVFFHSHLLETAALRVPDAVLLDSGTRGFAYQRRASLPGQIRPNPLQEHAHAQTRLPQVLEVDRRPREPRYEPAEMDLAALEHGEAFAHHGHAAFVEVAKRARRGSTSDPAANHFRCIAPLLHGYLRHAGKGLPVLLN